MAKRRSLGRGLDALLSPSNQAATARVKTAEGAGSDEVGTAPHADAPRAEDSLRELPLDLLQRGRYQPRIDMREETLADLAESIRAQGIVQPIVVRPVARAANGEARYEIIAGERRWRAAQLAGLHKLPALIKDIPDEAAVAVALIENIQRENLNPLEEARSLKQLVDEFGMTHAQAADAVGRSRVAVSNLLRLLELPDAVRGMLEKREIDMGHARALLAVTPPSMQLELAHKVLKDGWSVRETERAIRKLGGGANRPSRKDTNGQTKDPNVRRLEAELSEKLGAAVRIEHGTGGGKVVIRYYSLDELDGIVEHIH